MSSLPKYSMTVSAALLALGAAAPPASAASALAQAKTIAVHEQLRIFHGETKRFQPTIKSTVLIRRPARIKVIVTGVGSPANKPFLYVADGKIEREYNAFDNTYRTVPPQASSGIREMSQIDMLLNGGPMTPGKNARRTITSETLDGKKMSLITDTQAPGVGRDGNTYTHTTKTWLEAASRLPYRIESSVTKHSEANPREELDYSATTNFSGWTLNKSIPAAHLAWAPPAGAKDQDAPKLLEAGATAPDFTAIAPDGSPVKLSDYKGKIVVLDFWATWCGPCQAAMPHLQHLYDQGKDKGVVVLGICVWDEKGAYAKWVADKKGTYTFPTAFELAGNTRNKNNASMLYHVGEIPMQYVIDRNGKIAAASTGYTDGAHPLEDALHQLGADVPLPAGGKEYGEPKMLTAGTPAPDFTAITPDGSPVKLSDYKGKIVVLDFWATWCGPCQASMPHLQHVYDQVKDKNVAVLGICVWDDKDAYMRWLTDKKGTYNFPTAFDPAARGLRNIAASLYHVTGIPTQYVIDTDGKVAATTVGYDDGDHQLEGALQKLGVDIAPPSKSASAR